MKKLWLLAIVLAASCAACIGHNRLVTTTTRLEEVTIAPVESGKVPTFARRQHDGDRAYRLGLHQIAVPTSASETRARQLVQNVRYILNGFEADHGYVEQPLLIVITDRTSMWLPVNDGIVWPPNAGVRPAISVTGVCCTRADGGHEIAVVSGELDSLPSLYHEFCHAAAEGADSKHKFPGWVEWERRGDELSARIRARWR